MRQVQVPEVFTLDELARATGAPVDHIRRLADSGDLRLLPGTRFVPADEALRAGRRLRHAALAGVVAPPPFFEPGNGSLASRRPAAPAFASSLVHAALFVVAIGLTSMAADTPPVEQTVTEPARLVFIVSPGPGGGGGGGGLRNPLPARKVERRAARPKPAATTVPEVARPQPITPRPPESEPPRHPPPPAAITAPVVAAAADARHRDGVIEGGRADTESRGPGTGGGSGTGHGTGNGEGLGSGIGDGSGGGTGGGPYRPGSGIEPPRLLREVKADYTDEARRRGLSGDVVLEIVVRHDGTVGDVRIMRGLGAGLDARAVQAVRQWRFTPARRLGTPVDVLVEVAVEFMLR
jgi:TonB family protein